MNAPNYLPSGMAIQQQAAQADQRNLQGLLSIPTDLARGAVQAGQSFLQTRQQRNAMDDAKERWAVERLMGVYQSLKDPKAQELMKTQILTNPRTSAIFQKHGMLQALQPTAESDQQRLDRARQAGNLQLEFADKERQAAEQFKQQNFPNELERARKTAEVENPLRIQQIEAETRARAQVMADIDRQKQALQDQEELDAYNRRVMPASDSEVLRNPLTGDVSIAPVQPKLVDNIYDLRKLQETQRKEDNTFGWFTNPDTKEQEYLSITSAKERGWTTRPPKAAESLTPSQKLEYQKDYATALQDYRDKTEKLKLLRGDSTSAQAFTVAKQQLLPNLLATYKNAITATGKGDVYDKYMERVTKYRNDPVYRKTAEGRQLRADLLRQWEDPFVTNPMYLIIESVDPLSESVVGAKEPASSESPPVPVREVSPQQDAYERSLIF